MKNQERNIFPDKRSCERISLYGSMPVSVFPTTVYFGASVLTINDSTDIDVCVFFLKNIFY